MNVREKIISEIAGDLYFAIIVNNEVYADSGNYFIFDNKQSAVDAIKILQDEYELEAQAEIKEVRISSTKEENSLFCYIVIGKVEEANEYFLFCDECCGTDALCCFNKDIDADYIRDEVENDIGIITTAYLIVK